MKAGKEGGWLVGWGRSTGQWLVRQWGQKGVRPPSCWQVQMMLHLSPTPLPPPGAKVALSVPSGVRNQGWPGL